MLKLCPTTFEIVDPDVAEIRAKVTQFDEAAVEIEVIGVVSEAQWKDLAALIGEAMRQMELEG